MKLNEQDPKNKPHGAAADDEERKKQARAEEGGDDDEEFPDLFNEKDPDFDDPDEEEII